MTAILSVAGAFVLGLVLRRLSVHWVPAWLVASCIVPLYVLVAAFIHPSVALGATMWPLEILFGGLYGAAAAGIGVFVGSILAKRRAPMPDT
jgi:hypothetical protein